jgi:hypothetical protein
MHSVQYEKIKKVLGDTLIQTQSDGSIRALVQTRKVWWTGEYGITLVPQDDLMPWTRSVVLPPNRILFCTEIDILIEKKQIAKELDKQFKEALGDDMIVYAEGLPTFRRDDNSNLYLTAGNCNCSFFPPKLLFTFLVFLSAVEYDETTRNTIRAKDKKCKHPEYSVIENTQVLSLYDLCANVVLRTSIIN